MSMSISGSAHRAGMSALWHDADYVPERQIRPTEIHKSFDGMPLPQEEHESPKGELAYQKMEQFYDVAHQQMDAGLKGQAFLNGKPPPVHGVQMMSDGDDPTKIAHDEQTRTMIANQTINATRDSEAMRYQLRAEKNEANKKAASKSVPKTSNAGDALAKAKKAEHTLKMAEGLGVSMLAVATTQALDGGLSGGAIAEAASVVKAISTAKVAVGLTKPMKEMDEADVTTKRNVPRSFHFDPVDPVESK